MVMKLLLARDKGNDYQFRVHLDDTKVDADGQPDPDWIEEFTWGKERPQGRTATQYLNDIKREMKLLCQKRLAVKSAGTALSLEGQTL